MKPDFVLFLSFVVKAFVRILKFTSNLPFSHAFG
jgi:hypothetical protein